MSKIHFIKHHLINIWLNLIIHQSLPYYFRAMCRLWHQDKTAALVSVCIRGVRGPNTAKSLNETRTTREQQKAERAPPPTTKYLHIVLYCTTTFTYFVVVCTNFHQGIVTKGSYIFISVRKYLIWLRGNLFIFGSF